MIFEVFFIRKLKPKLNKQSDPICAKLFTKRFFIIHAAIFFGVFALFLCKYFRVLVSILLAFLQSFV